MVYEPLSKTHTNLHFINNGTMNSNKCFVNNCRNKMGIMLPQEESSKKAFLDKLQIKPEEGTISKFVCLAHFKQIEPAAETPKVASQPAVVPIKNKIEEEDATPQCRICLSEKNIDHLLSDELDPLATSNNYFSIASAIEFCLNIKLKQYNHDNEPLSNKVCTTCRTSLESFYQFKLNHNRPKRKIQTTLNDEEEVPVKISRVDEEGKTEFLTKDELSQSSEDRKAEIDKKFDKVEAELRMVLEGTLDSYHGDNIIIAITNDDEEPENQEVLIEEPAENVIEEPVEEEDEKCQVEDASITLPKTIKIKVAASEVNTIGKFEYKIRKYIYDKEFYEVDGYLFEFRLGKATSRFYRCINSTCGSVALESTTSKSTEFDVQKAHNHKKPNDKEMKKHMFYNILKKKMSSEKNVNFRFLYEEACCKDPELKELIPLRNVINEMCRHQLGTTQQKSIVCFEDLFEAIEDEGFSKLHYTTGGKQFYQERLLSEDGAMAIVFANFEILDKVSDSKLLYVDSSFRIDNDESFDYHLVIVLVWTEDSYYPILYALVNRKSQAIYKKMFEYLRDYLAPSLRPAEIVTDYESNLYYALGETYLESHIGGSVFYFTQNIYKKICSLNLSSELETNSNFRNIYHMILMLPLLPVNTILDGLNNIEDQAKDMNLVELTKDLFEHVWTQWISNVTADLFCVHRLENRINENVIAPFKKLRDYLMLSKGKSRFQTNIVHLIEKLIELESFLQVTYAAPTKKSFARDLSCSQKKNVLKAWQFIENHPKININHFFSKVLGYIKCMENQLWIWGFYRFPGDVPDELINANNFSIVNENTEEEKDDSTAADEETEEFTNSDESDEELHLEELEIQETGADVDLNDAVVLEAVIDEHGGFVLQRNTPKKFQTAFLRYVKD